MANGTWISTAGGSWQGLLNWQSQQVADGVGAVATFATNITGNATVSLDSGVTLGRLLMSDGGTAGSTWFVLGPSALSFEDFSTPQITATTPITILTSLAGTQGFTKLGAALLTLGAGYSSTMTGTISTSSSTSIRGTFTNGITLQLTGTIATNITIGASTLLNGTLDVQCTQAGFYTVISGTANTYAIGRMTGSAGKNIKVSATNAGTLSIGSDATGTDFTFDATIETSLVLTKVGANKAIIGPNGDLPFSRISKGEVELQSGTGLGSSVTVASIAKLTANFTGSTATVVGLEAGALSSSGPTFSVGAGKSVTVTTRIAVSPIRGTNAPAIVSVPSGATLTGSSLFIYDASTSDRLVDLVLKGGGTINGRFFGNGSQYVTVQEGTTFNEVGSSTSLYWDIEDGVVSLATTAIGTNIYANIEAGSVLTYGYPAAGAFTESIIGLTGSGDLRSKSSGIITLSTAAASNGLPATSAPQINFDGRIGGSGTNENNWALAINNGYTAYLNGGNNTYTGNTTIYGGGVLDGTGTITNSSVQFLAPGAGSTAAILGAGKGIGAGDFTVANVNVANQYPTFRGSKTGTGTVSKLAITTLTQTEGTTFIFGQGAGSGWLPGRDYVIAQFPTRASPPRVNSTARAWSDSGNDRVGNGRVTATTTQIILTPDLVPATVRWAGGVGGNWYNGASGFLNAATSNADNFYNGDTVIFDATSGDTATVTENLTMFGLTLAAASTAHTITTSTNNVITSGGALTVSAGTQTQTLGLSAVWSSISIEGPLTITNRFALRNSGGSPLGSLTLSSGANLFFNTTDPVTVPFAIVWPAAASATATIRKGSGQTITISGSTTSGGISSATTTVTGNGVLELTGSQQNYFQKIVVSDPASAPGQNVLRITGTTTTGSSGLSAGAMLALGNAGIFETNVGSFTRPLTKTSSVTLPTYFLLGSGGGGFSAVGANPLNISSISSFGAADFSWSGPIYFGTSYGSATNTTNLTSGTIALDGGIDQTFHVFAGSGDGNIAAVLGVISSAGAVTALRKRGPGHLHFFGTNTYTGTTFVEDGRLVLKNVRGLGASSATVNASKELHAAASASDSSGAILYANNMTLKAGSKVIIGA